MVKTFQCVRIKIKSKNLVEFMSSYICRRSNSSRRYVMDESNTKSPKMDFAPTWSTVGKINKMWTKIHRSQNYLKVFMIFGWLKYSLLQTFFLKLTRFWSRGPYKISLNNPCLIYKKCLWKILKDTKLFVNMFFKISRIFVHEIRGKYVYKMSAHNRI